MPGPLPEYPAPPGNKNWVIGTVAGPLSYASIVTGSPPTGGQSVKASDVGLVDIEFFECEGSDDGQFGVIAIYPKNPQTPVSSVLLFWYTLNTGAQVGAATNLSARTVRFRAIGH